MDSIEPTYVDAIEQAEKYYQSSAETLKAIRQDLRAVGKSEDEILYELITNTFIDAYCKAIIENNKLKDWLKKRAQEEGDSSRAWEKDSPGCQQSSYRAGAANTFVEVSEHLK